MSSFKKISVLLVIAFSLIAFNKSANSQGNIKNEKHLNGKVVVVKSKNHHFRKARVYHPHWAPRVSFKHRWVYFPRYNFYWDNFSNVYVYRTGTIWVTSTNPPQEVEKVDLSSVKKVELNENNDAEDSIQNNNKEHESVYKVD